MLSITLNAHFDGQQIMLGEPLEIPSNSRLLITVPETQDLERGDWTALSAEQLALAFAEDDPQ